MKHEKAIKMLGVATTILGFGITFVESWISDKQMDDKIAEKVKEALIKYDK